MSNLNKVEDNLSKNWRLYKCVLNASTINRMLSDLWTSVKLQCSTLDQTNECLQHVFLENDNAKETKFNGSNTIEDHRKLLNTCVSVTDQVAYKLKAINLALKYHEMWLALKKKYDSFNIPNSVYIFDVFQQIPSLCHNDCFTACFPNSSNNVTTTFYNYLRRCLPQLMKMFPVLGKHSHANITLLEPEFTNCVAYVPFSFSQFLFLMAASRHKKLQIDRRSFFKFKFIAKMILD
ncbi:hypothetical protein FF38_03245 [Lucilia cuprina]|uniref:Uncharacterized protein n=1 Tax=Lucilia cuprina TaxID=7375 RepID=A0A0L0BRL4_LUCCU|nr:hypothetical protein FF38_03245 [Lucilia cuprina]